MGYAHIIAHEAETLPPEKQIEVLDFIAFLKVRKMPAEPASSVKMGTHKSLASHLFQNPGFPPSRE